MSFSGNGIQSSTASQSSSKSHSPSGSINSTLTLTGHNDGTTPGSGSECGESEKLAKVRVIRRVINTFLLTLYV